MTFVNLQNFPGDSQVLSLNSFLTFFIQLQQYFGINSVTLEEKETACNMLFVFCEILVLNLEFVVDFEG